MTAVDAAHDFLTLLPVLLVTGFGISVLIAVLESVPAWLYGPVLLSGIAALAVFSVYLWERTPEFASQLLMRVLGVSVN